MEEFALYLRTVEDLHSKAVSHDAYDLLRASALIRQLILDDPPLAHIVNRDLKIKLRFRVVEWEPPPPEIEGLVFSWVDVSSGRAAPWSLSQPKFVKHDAFLATKCMAMDNQTFTVKDVIKACANIKGGVHRGGTLDEREAALVEFDRVIQIGGKDASVNLVRGIATALLIGLEPLTVALQGAAGGTRTHGS